MMEMPYFDQICQMRDFGDMSPCIWMSWWQSPWMTIYFLSRQATSELNVYYDIAGEGLNFTNLQSLREIPALNVTREEILQSVKILDRFPSERCANTPCRSFCLLA